MKEPTTIELEMGLSEKDFGAALVNAVKPYTITDTPNGYQLQAGQKHVLIEKTILSPRVIASIRLPRMRVTLTFPEQTDEEVTAFMQRFNRYMHRGGG